MTEAIFVGGSWDTVKMVLKSKPKIFHMFTPDDPDFATKEYTPERYVNCKANRYDLVFETPKGVLIYEYESG